MMSLSPSCVYCRLDPVQSAVGGHIISGSVLSCIVLVGGNPFAATGFIRGMSVAVGTKDRP